MCKQHSENFLSLSKSSIQCQDGQAWIQLTASLGPPSSPHLPRQDIPHHGSHGPPLYTHLKRRGSKQLDCDKALAAGYRASLNRDKSSAEKSSSSPVGSASVSAAADPPPESLPPEQPLHPPYSLQTSLEGLPPSEQHHHVTDQRSLPPGQPQLTPHPVLLGLQQHEEAYLKLNLEKMEEKK